MTSNWGLHESVLSGLKEVSRPELTTFQGLKTLQTIALTLEVKYYKIEIVQQRILDSNLFI